MCREIFASLLWGLMEHKSRALTGEQLSALEVVYRRVTVGSCASAFLRRPSQRRLRSACKGGSL